MSAALDLRFNSRLYTLDALRQTAGEFAALAEIRVEAGEPCHGVILEPKAGVEPQRLADEFGNYALSLMRA